jgi:probable rRNA maturation factor
MKDNFTLTINTQDKKPRIRFEDIKNTILGKKYSLSLVLIGNHLGKRLNKEHKDRDYPTNILSFPIETNEGEIFINMRRVEIEAKKFNHTPKQHLAFLFIHGCLHLSGLPHGNTMDKKEQYYMRKFNLM